MKWKKCLMVKANSSHFYHISIFYVRFVKFNWWKAKNTDKFVSGQNIKFANQCAQDLPDMSKISSSHMSFYYYSFPMHIVIDWYSPYSHNSHMLLTPRLTILKEGSYITLWWKNFWLTTQNYGRFSFTSGTMKVLPTTLI